MKHPIQPIIEINGILRFKQNAIVKHLLDWSTGRGMDLNKIATMDFSNEDRQQFAQLIGYSLSGYGELSYVDDDAYEAAEKMKTTTNPDTARAEALQEKLDEIRNALRNPMSLLFGIHPDDME